MFTTAAQRRGVHDKLMTFLKGPGWEPGKPRLGLEEDIPIVSTNSPHREEERSQTLC